MIETSSSQKCYILLLSAASAAINGSSTKAHQGQQCTQTELYGTDHTTTGVHLQRISTEKYASFLPFLSGTSANPRSPHILQRTPRCSTRGAELERESPEIIESNTETTSRGSTIKTMGLRCAITAGCRGSHLDGERR